MSALPGFLPCAPRGPDHRPATVIGVSTITRQPHPALRAYLADYVGYRYAPAPEAVHHGIPSATATLIVAFDEPLDSGWLGEPGSQQQYWMLAAGLHQRPALIRTHGWQHGIQLAMSPLGVRRLLGIPAVALADTMAQHADLPSGFPPSLHARIADATAWPERFDVLEAHLLRRLSRTDHSGGPAPEVTEAWRLLMRRAGQIRIEDIADAVGWSRRHLASRFAAEFGIRPKQAARLFRFERAMTLARRGLPLGDVAVQAGYADQAHLTREWTTYAGQPPTATLHESFTTPS